MIAMTTNSSTSVKPVLRDALLMWIPQQKERKYAPHHGDKTVSFREAPIPREVTPCARFGSRINAGLDCDDPELPSIDRAGAPFKLFHSVSSPPRRYPSRSRRDCSPHG